MHPVNKIDEIAGRGIWYPIVTLMLLSAATVTNYAQAGIVASATRLVYLHDKPQQSLMIANTNDYPVVVQTWIDNGDVNSSPDQASAPFISVPAVFRLQPSAVSSLRVINKMETLPQDRESVYWLNIYEIPPKQKTQDPTAYEIQMAINTQIKVFYRPASLSGDAQKALEALKFSVRREGNVQVVHCQNDTPFYASFGQMALESGKQKLIAEQQMDMMTAPFSGHDYRINMPSTSENTKKMTLYYILFDDQGNPSQHHTEIFDMRT